MSTIYVPKGSTYLYLQRWLDGKRLRLSTGLLDTRRARATVMKQDAMLSFLLENGRPDVIEAIRDPKNPLTLAGAYAEYRVGRWEKIPSALHAVDLTKAWTAWAKKAKRPKDGKPISDAQREDLKRGLVALQVPAGASVGQLPALLKQMREKRGEKGEARTFNRVRTNCMAFARAHGGQRKNPVWIDIAEVAPLDESVGKRAHNPLSPKDAAALAVTLGPGCGDDWWSLCLTGMRPSEFYSNAWAPHWSPVTSAPSPGVGPVVTIDGTKSRAASRVIPRLGGIQPPQRRFQQLSLVLRKKELGVTPYDARRSFAHWLEMAGIPDSRCDAYLGHKSQGVRGLYREHSVRDHLEADRKALLNFMGEIGR